MSDVFVSTDDAFESAVRNEEEVKMLTLFFFFTLQASLWSGLGFDNSFKPLTSVTSAWL